MKRLVSRNHSSVILKDKQIQAFDSMWFLVSYKNMIPRKEHAIDNPCRNTLLQNCCRNGNTKVVTRVFLISLGTKAPGPALHLQNIMMITTTPESSTPTITRAVAIIYTYILCELQTELIDRPRKHHTHTHQYAQTRPTTSTTSETMPTSRSACLDLSQYHSSNSNNNNNSTATDKDNSHSMPNHPPTTHVAHYWGTEPNTAATFSGCLSPPEPSGAAAGAVCGARLLLFWDIELSTTACPAHAPPGRQAARSLRPGSTLSHGPPKGLACFRMRRWRVRFAVRY